MRELIASALLIAACGNGREAALEEVRKHSEAAAAEEAARVRTSKSMTVPVPNEAKLPCTQVIHNLEAYQTALGEKDPLELRDVTPKKGDLAADCTLVRGGKKLSAAEQDKILKDKGRLGVVPGDVLCGISLRCYTIETAENFKKRCAEKRERADEQIGSFACVQVVGTGAFDVEVYRFYDEDTRCVIEARGGPSNTENETIRTCAKVARDSIGPAQITVAK